MGKREGEEGGSLLSVVLGMSWGMAQQETAGAFPAVLGGLFGIHSKRTHQGKHSPGRF